MKTPFTITASQRGRPPAQMEKSCLDYAMSVIVGRALPDVRDGSTRAQARHLCDVRRRLGPTLVFEVGEGRRSWVPRTARRHLRHRRATESTVVDALSRCCGPRQLRHARRPGRGRRPLSADGASYAEMVRDIKEQTVDFEPNPTARFWSRPFSRRASQICSSADPGIAVSMATRIPPHNLREVAAGVSGIWRTPATKRRAARGPHPADQGADFPSKALILGTRGIGHVSHRPRSILAGDRRSGRDPQAVPQMCRHSLSGQPRPPARQDGRGHQDGRLPGIATPVSETSGARRSAHRRRSEEGRRGWSCSTTSIATPSFRTTSRQHAARRRRSPARSPRRLRSPRVTFPTTESSSAAPNTGSGRALKRLHILEVYLKALDQLNAVALIRSSQTVDLAHHGPHGPAGDRRDRPDPRDESCASLAALERRRSPTKYEEAALDAD